MRVVGVVKKYGKEAHSVSVHIAMNAHCTCLTLFVDVPGLVSTGMDDHIQNSSLGHRNLTVMMINYYCMDNASLPTPQ